MNDETILKPCPFCGATYVMAQAERFGDHIEFYVTCKECGSQGPNFTARFGKIVLAEFIKSAVDAWNKRGEVR